MEMESFAGSAEMTLFWHCIFPGDISSKPRRREIYACGDCGEDCDGFRGVVLWLGDPEHPHTSLCSICHSSLTTSPFLRVSPRSLSLPETRTVRRARMHQREPPWRGCTTPKIHTCEADKGTERAKVRLQWKAVTFYFLSVCTCRSTFSSLGSILSLQTSGRWIVPSAARRSEFHFANLATLSFSHAKQHKFLSPPRSVNCQSELSPSLSHAARRSLQKKNIQKKKEKNSEMINLWGIAADSADMSEQEWRSLKLSRHPSVARWHPRSPLRLMFFPCSWWAAMAGSVKCTRLVHRSADGDLSRHRRAT